MGGIPRSTGDFPESLSQAMLVGCNVSREIGRRLSICIIPRRSVFFTDTGNGNKSDNSSDMMVMTVMMVV